MSEHVPTVKAPLEWAARGFNVFPVNTNTKAPPLVNEWQHAATADAAKIEAWAAEFPGCNWGWVPDRSGYVIADLDMKPGKDGIAEFKKLMQERGRLDGKTLVFGTPSGGRHLVLKGRAPNSVSRVAPGVDVRGMHEDKYGYGLLPGSTVDGVAYTVKVDPGTVADAPQWFLEAAKPATTAPRAKTVIGELDIKANVDRARLRLTALVKDRDVAVKGQGADDRTYRLACEMLDLGVSPDTAYDLMTEIWYPHCTPNDRPEFIARKIESANNYAQNEPGSKGVDALTTFAAIVPPITTGAQPSTVTELDDAPLDIFGDNSVTPEAVLTHDMLPAAIADAAFDEAERQGVTPSSVAMPMLSVCASVLHDGIRIQPKQHDRTWRESARLWSINVSPVGGKKSPSQRAALRPLHEMAAELQRQHATAEALHETIVSEWEASRKAYLNGIKDGAAKHIAKGNAEVQGYGADELPPAAPKAARLYVNDVTVEKLARILSENGRGLLAQIDELPSLLASFDAYRANGTAGKDRALWLELYEGDPKVIDRVNGGSIHVPHWGASLVANIQPDKLAKLAPSLSDDGLLQRAMLTFGGSTGRGVDREENTAALNAYRAVVRSVYRLEPMVPATPILFDWDAQEWRERAELLTEAMMGLPTTPAALCGHLAKWSGLFARLCLTFHAIENAGHGPLSGYVTGETAERVYRFMVRAAPKLVTSGRYRRCLI